MGLLTRLRMEFESFFGLNSGAADYDGNAQVKFPPMDLRWPDGSTASKANLAWSDYEVTLNTATTRSLDLRSLPSITGGTLTFAEIRAIGIYVKSVQAADALLFAKGAANGFTGFGSAFSMVVQRGSWVWLVCPLDGEYPTGAADKVLDITNSSGGTVTYSLVIVGTAS